MQLSTARAAALNRLARRSSRCSWAPGRSAQSDCNAELPYRRHAAADTTRQKLTNFPDDSGRHP
eukprot:6181102-Pleurochrysis_carterae.AAC.3